MSQKAYANLPSTSMKIGMDIPGGGTTFTFRADIRLPTTVEATTNTSLCTYDWDTCYLSNINQENGSPGEVVAVVPPGVPYSVLVNGECYVTNVVITNGDSMYYVNVWSYPPWNYFNPPDTSLIHQIHAQFNMESAPLVYGIYTGSVTVTLVPDSYQCAP